MKTPLCYITSNDTKFHEAELILEPVLSEKTNFSLVRKPIALDEIQGPGEEIAVHKTKSAFAVTGGLPVIIDDISLYIDALNGLPGPYIKAFLEQLGTDGIWKLISKLESTSAHVTCRIGFMRDEQEGPHIFSGTFYGNITSPKGVENYGNFSWNAIFQPRGMDITIGQMSLEEISKISPRCIALTQLRQFLLMEEND